MNFKILHRGSLLVFGIFLHCMLLAQCETNYPKNQSPKIANYEIEARLDHEAKMATCSQKLRWQNTSPDTLKELRFYMYINAFKDVESSYLRGGNMNIFGQDLRSRTEEEWGYITMTKIIDAKGNDLTAAQKYIQPNDGNEKDQSVASVQLAEPILPGESIELNIDFIAKMPKTIVRTGYGKNDFFLFVHWFPQVGVYEQNNDGVWGWNCHQFFRGTEFFADFGDYKVTVDASEHLTIGGSGCRISEERYDGRQIVQFVAHDLIDFGWVAYSEYDVYTHRHKDTDIEILMPPEHCAFADRYLDAVIWGLDYLEEYVGEYPYPKITVVDPPVHTLNSGFMEYPMMITGASFYGIPSSIRSVESLVIHEFTHMYFMATLASNEKEEAWLDEGFVTYYEDRILDHYHGEKGSFYNVFGFRSGNRENSRLEYTGMNNPSEGSIARPGWEFNGAFKELIYAKTATMLTTLERIVGQPIMDEIVQTYYEAYKFKHPKEADLRKIISEVLPKHKIDYPLDVDHFLDQALHGVSYCDFAVQKLNDSSFIVEQKGKFEIPVEIRIVYKDNTIELLMWDGVGKEKTYNLKKAINEVVVDPDQKIYLDLDFNNNGMSRTKDNKAAVKYASKSVSWTQTLLQYLSLLM